MSAAPFILTIRCHYCSEHVHPKEVIRIGDDVIMCWSCYEKHKIQVEAFHPPHECSECRRTFEQISAATLGDKVKMYPHWKDGMYQILCEVCDAVYVQKRKDLYGPTQFGWERKLK